MNEENNRASELYLSSGSTPMTLADLITRECPDREFLESVIFFINAYIEHELPSRACNMREGDEE